MSSDTTKPLLSTGAIVGITVGGLIVVGLVAWIIYRMVKRNKLRKINVMQYQRELAEDHANFAASTKLMSHAPLAQRY